jgi:HK97 family phage portal protein
MIETSVLTVDSQGVSDPMASVVKDYGRSDFLSESRFDIGGPDRLTSLNAIKHGAVWAAVNIISGDVGQIPFNVMHRERNQWVRDDRHPVAKLLGYKPNAWQTPSVFKEWVTATRLIWGNAIAWIRRDRMQKPVELVPVPPQYVDYDIDEESGLPYYRITAPLLRMPAYLELDEVLHFRGLTSNGFWGYRLVEVAYDVLSLGRNVTKHAAASFENGAAPGGVLEHPGKLPLEARKELREAWDQRHGGAGRAGRTAVLWEGMKFNPITASNVDAQLLEVLAEETTKVAQLFQIPPHKLGDLRHSSVRSNLEESNREYYSQTLSRFVYAMRDELAFKLLANPETYTIKPDPEELLKGDKLSQLQVAQIALASMVWTRNEARDYIGMGPVPDGDAFANPNTTASTPPPAPRRGSAAPAAMLAECKVAVRAETAKLARAAETSRNFVAYAERFYASAWSDLVVDVVSAGTAEAARKYAEHSHAAVMVLAENVKTGKELAECIRQRDEPAYAAMLSSIIMEAAA